MERFTATANAGRRRHPQTDANLLLFRPRSTSHDSLGAADTAFTICNAADLHDVPVVKVQFLL